MVLIYPGPLPRGALVRETPVRETLGRETLGPAAKPALASGQPVADVWLDAATGVSLSGAGRVLGWTSRGPRPAQARPVSGNVTGTGFLNDPPALHFVAGENGGFRLSDAIADGAALTFGLIVTPDLPEARTLVSLQPLAHEDYTFLSLDGMHMRLARRDADNALALTLPDDTRGPLLIVCALGGDEVRLSVNDGPVLRASLPAQSGPADLFIGCRNGRKGMKNKLGGFDLSDVMVWPGQDLLCSTTLPPTLIALWEDRCRRGV